MLIRIKHRLRFGYPVTLYEGDIVGVTIYHSKGDDTDRYYAYRHNNELLCLIEKREAERIDNKC